MQPIDKIPHSPSTNFLPNKFHRKKTSGNSACNSADAQGARLRGLLPDGNVLHWDVLVVVGKQRDVLVVVGKQMIAEQLVGI